MRVVACALLFAVSVSCRAKPEAPAPGPSWEFSSGCPGCNVLLVTLDTARADELPCYGYDRDTAPRICGIARQGILFEHAYSAAPNTIPALHSIMNGAIIANEDPLAVATYASKVGHLAEAMKARGYVTAAFTDHPALGRRGKVKPKNAMLQRGFDVFENLGSEVPELELRGVNGARVGSAVAGWLANNRSRKVFMWVHFFDPHYDYLPVPEDEGLFGYGADTCGRIRNGMTFKEMRGLRKDLTAKEIECVRALHQAELFATDRRVGGIVDALAELGLADRTVVVIAADHGEEFEERGELGHGHSVHDELIRVPLVLLNPRGGGPSRVARAASTRDIARIVPAMVDGRTVRLDERVASRTYRRVFVKPGGTVLTKRPDSYALVEWPVKCICDRAGKEHECHDLAVDPAERTDVSGSPDGERVLGHLREWIGSNTVEAGTPSAQVVRQLERMGEQMRALGYAE
jgi:choline-sulfatase